MNVPAALVTIVLLAAVIALISDPLRLQRRASHHRSADRSELEAARESKYREIRDAQLDYQTGKLSDEDFASVDAGLRREALEILRRLDEVEQLEREEREREARPGSGLERPGERRPPPPSRPDGG